MDFVWIYTQIYLFREPHISYVEQISLQVELVILPRSIPQDLPPDQQQNQPPPPPPPPPQNQDQNDQEEEDEEEEVN